MSNNSSIERGDRQLLRIIDSAFSDAARRSGTLLACRPGCTQCCHGVFAISQLDARRLRAGLQQLETLDPQRAARVRRRARASLKRIRAGFPGDNTTGILDESPEADARFEDFANDERCPALDLRTGRCDLYDSRPTTCRVFGPPVRTEGGLGCCELCYQGATPQQIAACEMSVDPEGLETTLIAKVESASGIAGRTLIQFVLAE